MSPERWRPLIVAERAWRVDMDGSRRGRWLEETMKRPLLEAVAINERKERRVVLHGKASCLGPLGDIGNAGLARKCQKDLPIEVSWRH